VLLLLLLLRVAGAGCQRHGQQEFSLLPLSALRLATHHLQLQSMAAPVSVRLSCTLTHRRMRRLYEAALKTLPPLSPPTQPPDKHWVVDPPQWQQQHHNIHAKHDINELLASY
jgi:hypothetical protein